MIYIYMVIKDFIRFFETSTLEAMAINLSVPDMGKGPGLRQKLDQTNGG